MHRGSTEQEPERVGVVWQHHLNRFGLGLRRALRREIHTRSSYFGITLARPDGMRFAIAVGMCLALAGGGDSAGSTIRVPSGGDLQAALERAKPGDTILLARDGRYAGNFVLPA